MRIVIRVRARRQEVREVLGRLPALVAGRSPDTTGHVRSLQLALGMIALSLIKQAFVAKSAGGEDEAGQRWAPLAASTLAGRRKGKGGGSPQILRDTGRLLNSLSPGVDNPTVRHGQVIVGTNVPYAVFLHEGTPRMPARRLWPEPKDWPEHWWAQLATSARAGVVSLITALVGGRAG